MTHDELSALSRLQFDSFSDMIRYGVAVDGHPAGVQTFLYYWTAWFGLVDGVVKLPFLLMGVGSIYLSYILGKKWFGPNTGLLTATMIATLQFSVMYSQIARPYASGLFLCLWATILWSSLVFEKGGTRSAIFFSIVGALCCYNHYFSMLFIGLLCGAGLFYIKKDQWKLYVLSILGIAALFSPHAWIFIQQFSMKGLNWLAPPRPFFLVEHLMYIFGFNSWLILTLLLGAAWGMIRSGIPKNDKLFICLFLFTVPLFIAFLYSHWRQPVMQHSIFLFTMPFLLLSLFSFYEKPMDEYRLYVMVILVSLSIWTITGERRHYSIFYKQPFNHLAETVDNEILEMNDQFVLIAHGMNPEYINHYLKPMDKTYQLVTTFDDSLSTADWERQLEGNYHKIIAMNIPTEYVSLVRDKNIYHEEQINGFIHTIHLFTRKQPDNELLTYRQNLWEDDKAREMKDTILPIYLGGVKDIFQNRHRSLQVSTQFKGSNPVKAEIICEILKEPGYRIRRNSYLWNYSQYPTDTIWNAGYLTMDIMDLYFWNEELDGEMFIFIRKPPEDQLYLKDVKMEVLLSNPLKYALFEPI